MAVKVKVVRGPEGDGDTQGGATVQDKAKRKARKKVRVAGNLERVQRPAEKGIRIDSKGSWNVKTIVVVFWRSEKERTLRAVWV
jgi:hypothetical protein